MLPARSPDRSRLCGLAPGAPSRAPLGRATAAGKLIGSRSGVGGPRKGEARLTAAESDVDESALFAQGRSALGLADRRVTLFEADDEYNWPFEAFCPVKGKEVDRIARKR